MMYCTPCGCWSSNDAVLIVASKKAFWNALVTQINLCIWWKVQHQEIHSPPCNFLVDLRRLHQTTMRQRHTYIMIICPQCRILWFQVFIDYNYNNFCLLIESFCNSGNWKTIAYRSTQYKHKQVLWKKRLGCWVVYLWQDLQKIYFWNFCSGNSSSVSCFYIISKRLFPLSM